MAMFAFQLPDALAAKFDAIASGGRSKRLRELVAEAVGQEAPRPPTAARGQSTKLTIRLKDEDQAALIWSTLIDWNINYEKGIIAARKRPG